MTRLCKALTSLILAAWMASVSGSPAPVQKGRFSISTEEEISKDFSSVPCKGSERLAAARALFERMGATQSDLAIERHKNVETLYIESRVPPTAE